MALKMPSAYVNPLLATAGIDPLTTRCVSSSSPVATNISSCSDQNIQASSYTTFCFLGGYQHKTVGANVLWNSDIASCAEKVGTVCFLVSGRVEQ
eukprot:m.78355 g.78355  ORF g.78355 m.78355 type:complete len:95 (+) comp14500_c0_seq10:844-1128(+)